MCKHVTQTSPFTLKQIKKRVLKVNQLLEYNIISIGSYHRRKTTLLSYVCDSHRPVIANLFIV